MGTTCPSTAQLALPENPGRASWAVYGHVVPMNEIGQNSRHIVYMVVQLSGVLDRQFGGGVKWPIQACTQKLISSFQQIGFVT